MTAFDLPNLGQVGKNFISLRGFAIPKAILSSYSMFIPQEG